LTVLTIPYVDGTAETVGKGSQEYNQSGQLLKVTIIKEDGKH
jgi:hypothetical protein